MIGGPVRVNAQGTNGPLETGLGVADAGDLDAHGDLAIIGVSSIDAKRGFLTGNIPEARLMREMMEHCGTVIVVADSSKFNKAAFARVAPLSTADIFITEKTPPADIRNALETAHVRLITPPTA